MSGSARSALMTSIGLMILRRRLQRRGGPGAAVALVGLELFGPRILRARRVLVWVSALTIVGGIAAAAIWWARRGGRVTSEPAPASSDGSGAPPVTSPAAA
jgi:hypothetical protein